jgi:hypothetical protein
MVEIGNYTGKKVEDGACPICGETENCCLNDPSVKWLPAKWEIEKAKREYFEKKLGLRGKSKLKQMNL